MPIYVYECSNKHRHEKLVSSYKTTCPPCPECDEPTRKVPAAGAFLLRGGGWAKDGYSKEKA